ncbi:glycosyl transferase family 2 [Pseudopedobacter saltans DSM 12145]|uniref:Glycosyl transferase family 2 n=1 Tax=Pseudopedobacter saltans (strain ATCC 51119 / DSM 12145 / JCM 21818 / CCUG 39354 / LMG 10337 / NBRC 100064 / NCIMB 13643) TaxID=762903 RepID=F0SBF5_PSESL|nr:glycosyltransferase [Pseudopedobacter saltans]ADY51601.1 glycosyl transferase family 2 [Pseudopedobacter saltans DSM 12145]
MGLFKAPDWINDFTFDYEKAHDIPQNVFDEINAGLDKLQKNDPLVTVLISAWNEEVNILRCLASLSKQRTNIPMEIIVVNNNSQDNTQYTIDKFHVRSLFQGIQGCGPARQLGQENAKGKYILLADADCLYPDCWIEEMMKVLQQRGVSCVYGRYSFIPEKGFPRFQLFFFEKMKDVIAEFRHLRKPYLNCFGISMGFVKEYSLKVGFVMTKFWGDDGKMALGLMNYGKIKQVKINKARVWTGVRSLQRDGNFIEALMKRLKKEAKRFTGNFFGKLPES